MQAQYMKSIPRAQVKVEGETELFSENFVFFKNQVILCECLFSLKNQLPYVCFCLNPRYGIQGCFSLSTAVNYDCLVHQQGRDLGQQEIV